MRGETDSASIRRSMLRFQSTPLMRGETAVLRVHAVGVIISIHSPHTRGDASPASSGSPSSNFNPLPSCEGRLRPPQNRLRFFQFQSTPLMRGETKVSPAETAVISDFNPLPSCEGRLSIDRGPKHRKHFNPLPSCEGRHLPFWYMSSTFKFQSTPLMRGETTGKWNARKDS